MRKALTLWQLAGFVFASLAGVFLHFLFDWTDGSILVAPFSAVNESIWEHMKILFFPVFVFALVQGAVLGEDYPEFRCVKLWGGVLGVGLIPVLYYTINGVLGATPDWVNIAIFFITAAVSYFVEWWLFGNECIKCNESQKALPILIIIAVLFAVWTFIPPRIPLFEDPVTHTYGYYMFQF